MIIQNCCEVDLCWKKPILNIQLKWIEPIYTDIEQSFSTESWSFGGRELDRLLLMEGEEREGGGGKIVGSRPVELQTQQFFALDDDALAI